MKIRPCITRRHLLKGLLAAARVPADWRGFEAVLHLERVHWQSTVWVDGRQVGQGDSLGTPHEYALGMLARWNITPARRKSDVVVGQPQAGPLTPVVPANNHPLRTGADQNGGTRFAGKIGRVTMFRGNISPHKVKELAASDPTKPVAAPEVIGCWVNPKPGDVLPTRDADFSTAIWFEAWILPRPNESGRILDKTTVGRKDGFLLDTYPGLGLRLVVGNERLELPHVLRAGVWQHVAVALDRGFVSLYLGGQPLNK